MFYVDTNAFMPLTGLSRQSIGNFLAKDVIVAENIKNKNIFDIDLKINHDWLNRPNKRMPASRKEGIISAMVKFDKDRISGAISCAKTGMVDSEASKTGLKNPLAQSPSSVKPIAPSSDSHDLDYSDIDDTALERKKKELEVAKLDKTVAKLDASVKAITGDLISRDYVESYIHKYLGTLHKQVLGLASSGMGDDIFNLIKQEEGTGHVIPKMEKLIEKQLSQLLKDTSTAIERNRI